jgi:hypothetical protein
MSWPSNLGIYEDLNTIQSIDSYCIVIVSTRSRVSLFQVRRKDRPQSIFEVIPLYNPLDSPDLTSLDHGLIEILGNMKEW